MLSSAFRGGRSKGDPSIKGGSYTVLVFYLQLEEEIHQPGAAVYSGNQSSVRPTKGPSDLTPSLVPVAV